MFHFQVAIDGKKVEAFLSLAACRADRGHGAAVLSLGDFYSQHRPGIDEIVSAKISAGARRPVVVMARDLQRLPPGPVQQVAASRAESKGPAREPGSGPGFQRHG